MCVHTRAGGRGEKNKEGKGVSSNVAGSDYDDSSSTESSLPGNIPDFPTSIAFPVTP